VQRPIALRTMRMESDPLDRLDPMPALPAVHRQQFLTSVCTTMDARRR
jgi:hypothetical protein